MANLELTTHQKPWSETELLDRLKRQELSLPPVHLRLDEAQFTSATSHLDGVIEVSWQGQRCRFVFDYKALSTPKSLEMAIAQVERYARETGLRPLVIVPYLPERSLRLLEAEGISGIDLSGNGILLAPNLVFWRSGQPNRFKEAAAIRNIFWGTSSLLARCFLLRSEFSSLTNLRAYALGRFLSPEKAGEAVLTKGTVSKVVQGLEEQQIITRTKAALRLQAPQDLLERLKTNYRKPKGARLLGKMPFTPEEAWGRLSASSLRATTTGEGSAAHYRVLSGLDTLTLYVEDLEKAQTILEVKEGPLFPNVELIEERSALYYFDARSEGTILWASPIQTWLELTLSGPRERDAAAGLKAIMIKGEGERL